MVIDKNTLIKDALKEIPGSEKVFLKYGVHCIG